MNPTVTVGGIILHSLHIVIDHDDVKVYWGDLGTKYADCSTVWADHTEVVLFKSDRTLRATSDEPTTISFPVGMDDNWVAEAYVARYTLYIVLYRPNREGTMVWQPAACTSR